MNELSAHRYFSTFLIHVSWEPDQSYLVKNGSCCKLELVRTKSVFVLPYSCYLSAVGCSQVELSHQQV